MAKILVFITLFLSYAGYSVVVYTAGTDTGRSFSAKDTAVANGKQLFQQYNCIACHQVYGLGGYLGPDLTQAYDEMTKGSAYMKAMLTSGGSRMPAYNFTEREKEDVVAYLRYLSEAEEE